MELIFFLVFGTVLHFGFRMRKNAKHTLIFAEQCLTQSQGLFLMLPCPRSWEGTGPGQLTQIGQRDIPYRMTSCEKLCNGGELARGAAAAQGMAEHRLAGGEQLFCASLCQVKPQQVGEKARLKQ